MLTLEVPVTWYELPADGDAAEQQVLALLRSPGETWIKAYNFSLPPLFDEIRAASKAGIVGHCLLDHTQSSTPSEHMALIQLAKDCASNWEFIITTAGGDSKSTGQIEHDKMLVAWATDGGQAHCWTGSVNLSASGFKQGNQAAYFRSDDWAIWTINEFERHKRWALAYQASWQLPK